MTHEEAVIFLKNGIKPKKGLWLDLGAGSGIFSKALSTLLPAGSKIFAIDKTDSVLKITNPNPDNEIIPIQTDFNDLPELPQMDGILMANSLHYVKTPVPFLQKLIKKLLPIGAFVLIEYDIEKANYWVPFPISFEKWQTISSAAGLSAPEIFNEKISHYGQGRMYASINYLSPI